MVDREEKKILGKGNIIIIRRGHKPGSNSSLIEKKTTFVRNSKAPISRGGVNKGGWERKFMTRFGGMGAKESPWATWEEDRCVIFEEGRTLWEGGFVDKRREGNELLLS